ncbi:restriction endonuclease subunit S [Acinetobacter seifertii]|uniref:restriction endonuclease subunit S n=1 Tax=Acinetobacter seifertii TaxID=1530123 RepID=UPI0032B44016
MATPKLRFKEFDGDWNQVKISDYSNTVTSGSRDWAQYYSDKGDKFIRMTNLVRDGIYLDLSDLRFVDLPKDSNEGKRTSLQSGDILISITAELGKLGWINSDLGTAYINQHTALVRMNENVDSKFVAYTLSTEKYNNKLNNLNDSGAKAGLNLGTIRNFELTIPQKKEQTKIASFLSSVDEKISQLNQKHELLSQYKQGMMQKLFSQKIRFKADDGSEFEEWENLYIGDLCKITTGNKDTQNKVNNGAYPFFVRSQTVEQINSYSMDCEAVLTSGDGVGVGKNYHYINGKFDFHQRVYCLYNFSEIVLGKYLYIYFSSFFYDRVKRLSAKNSVDSVRMDMISKMQIQLPCLEEQIKISNFFSAIDQKIEVVAQQIEQANQWKKGLLQQMFV